MTLRTSGPARGRRWAILGATVAALVLSLATIALATNIGGFEIDAAQAAAGSDRPYYSGNDAAGAGNDWAAGGSAAGIFQANASGDNPVTSCYGSDISANPAIDGAAGVICDGSSDPGFKTVEPEQSIVSPSGKTPDDKWPIKPGNNTPKNDVTHAYTQIDFFDSPCDADTVENNLIVYVAGERLNNEGDSFWGFELNQVAPGGFSSLLAANGSSFTLDFNRSINDVLLSVSLSKGGTAPTIEVYKVTGINAATQEAVFSSASGTCSGTPISQGQTNATSDALAPPWNVPVCDPSTTKNANACRLVNGAGSVAGNLGDTMVPPRDFIEAAIDLTEYGIAPACFNNVLFTSRSSTSITADLKDVGGGTVPLCTASAATQIHAGSSADPGHSTADIQGTSVNIGTVVHDKVTVSGSSIGTAPTPTGTVTFQRFTTSNCTGTAAASETVTLVGGVAETSDFTTNAAGSLSYLATYNGDTNYPGTAVAACEPLTVAKLPSTTTTAIHAGTNHTTDIQGTTVDVGTSVHDQATVTGSGPTPTGTVTFKRYTNGTCTGDPAATETVSLTSGKAESSNFTTVAGSMSYKASYGGDANYLASDESGCETLTAITPSTLLDKAAQIDSVSVVVTYSYKEKNDGSVDLTMPADGYVEDDSCAPVKIVGDDGDNALEPGEQWSGDADEDGILSAGETWDFTCTTTLTSVGDHTNVALGHGIDPVGLDVTYCTDAGNPPSGVRCDGDERDTATVSISASVTNQGKDDLFNPTLQNLR